MDRTNPLIRDILITVIIVSAAACFLDMHTINHTFKELTEKEGFTLEEIASGGLKSEIIDIHVEDETITVTFRFSSAHDQPIVLKKVSAAIYANGTYLGTLVTDEAVLKPGESTLTCELVVRPPFVQNLGEIINSEKIQWQLTGYLFIGRNRYEFTEEWAST